MTTEARGRIVLYIDDKEVTNSVKSIKAELQKITNEQNKMIIGSKEYVAAGKNIKELKGTLQEHNDSLKSTTNKWMEMLGPMALAAAGIAAATAGWKLYKNVVESSEASLDKFEAMMNGIHKATQSFFTVVREGDWSNLINRMTEAYDIGVKYQETLDRLSKSERALTYVRSVEHIQMAQLEEDLKNKSLSDEERLAAGQKWMALETEINRRELINAKNRTDNELNNLNLKGKTNAEARKLIETLLIEDYNNQHLREDAEKLNETYSELLNTRKILAHTINNKENKVEEKTTVNERDIKLLEGRNDAVAQYAKLLRETEGSAKRELIDNAIKALQKENEVQTGVWDNNKRIINTINSEQAKMNAETEKATKQGGALSGIMASLGDSFKKAYDQSQKMAADKIQVAEDWANEDNIILQKGYAAYIEYLQNRKNADEDYWTYTARRTEETVEQQIQYWKDFYNEDYVIQQVGEEQYSKYLKDRKNADETYFEWIKRKFKETEEFKKKQLETTVTFSRIITDGIANYYAAAKDRELIMAGDNEEKKKEINKKYADKEFAVSIARIVVSTAEAIMQAYAQLGPFAGTIAAVLMAGVGVAEIGVANAQRNQIKGLNKGGVVEGQGNTDTEMRMLTPGEYVNRQPVVQKIGSRFFDILNADPVNPDIDGAIASLGRRGGSQSVTSAQGMAASDTNIVLYEVGVAIDKLNKKLDQGLKAVAYYDQEETIRLRKNIKKMDEIDVSAKK